MAKSKLTLLVDGFLQAFADAKKVLIVLGAIFIYLPLFLLWWAWDYITGDGD